MNHSPEPWQTGEPFYDNDRGDIGTEIKAGGETVAVAVHFCEEVGLDGVTRLNGLCCGPGDPAVGKANAERIVACVNACAGIPTNELEARLRQLLTTD